MIDKSKTYRTRDGREVRIYATDGNAPYCIHGAVLNEDGWTAEGWLSNGKWDRTDNVPLNSDLIEVKPRIKREVWVNVYPEDIQTLFYRTKEAADRGAVHKRIACVKLTIDCEEGEGL